MNNFSMVMAMVLLCSCIIRYVELLPITGSQQPGVWNDISFDENPDADAFMVDHSVTQEEIEEFHRLNGFAPHESSAGDDQEQGQGRSFSKIGAALKFWNWPAFENFRAWIQERRSRTTTVEPIPVYIVNNPHSYPYNNIYQSRPSYVK